MKRRDFCAITSVAALGSLLGSQAHADSTSEERPLDSSQLQTGNGEWTYHVVSNWGELPQGKAFGGTHGGIATDKDGHLYVSTQSATGVLVYDRDGKLLARYPAGADPSKFPASPGADGYQIENGGTGPEACPKLTSVPKVARHSSDPENVSAPTPS